MAHDDTPSETSEVTATEIIKEVLRNKKITLSEKSLIY